MRERAPQFVQPPNQPSAGWAIPAWAWAVLLLVLAGGGLAVWLLLNPARLTSTPAPLPPASLAHPTLTRSAPPTFTPTHTPSPTITIPPPTATPSVTLQYGVARSGLNVRQRPTASSPVIAALSRGAIVTLVGAPVQAGGYAWYQRQEGGWVAGQLLTIYPTLGAAKKGGP